jgi:hypothetical protein
MHQDDVAGARCDCGFGEANVAYQRERGGDTNCAQEIAPVGRRVFVQESTMISDGRLAPMWVMNPIRSSPQCFSAEEAIVQNAGLVDNTCARCAFTFAPITDLEGNSDVQC